MCFNLIELLMQDSLKTFWKDFFSHTSLLTKQIVNLIKGILMEVNLEPMFCPEEINTFTCSRQDYFEEGIDSTCASALVQIVYFSKDRGGILTKPFQWDVNESLVVRFTDKSPLLA